MALKYGSSSKSSAFKRSAFPMQSGTVNHASAVKQVEEKDADRLKRLIGEKKTKEGLENIEGTPEYLKKLKQTNIRQGETDYIAEQKAKKEAKTTADAKAKVDATRGTHPDQIKKQSKGYYSLDKIQERQDKKFQNKKGKASDKVINKMNKIGTLEDKQKKHEPGSKRYNSLQKRIDKNKGKLAEREKKEEKFEGETSSKETKRETRLKKEVGMTPEEYTAYKEKKKEASREEMRRTVAGLREYGPGGSGSQTEGKAKYDAGKIAQSNKEKTQASQDIRDARTKQLTEAYAANLKKEGELDPNTSAAVDENGDAKMTANEGTQAQLRKNKTT